MKQGGKPVKNFTFKISNQMNNLRAFSRIPSTVKIIELTF